MRTDPEFLKRLFTVFLDSETSAVRTRALDDALGNPDAEVFTLHMLLLFDDGLIESDSPSHGIGFSTTADGLPHWDDHSLRLTAEGQRLAEALENEGFWQRFKETAKSSGFAAAREAVSALIKGEVTKHLLG